jgi:hypothetical protein
MAQGPGSVLLRLILFVICFSLLIDSARSRCSLCLYAVPFMVI